MRYWYTYTRNQIQPCGWLKKQLELQAEGLSGNLDRVWRDIRDSSWIGGDAEGWERVPYWLDGFIPLAYLLEDENMISRAQKYMNAILAQQKEDGWICPCSEDQRPSYDSWAVQLITKVLTVYYECSQDQRIPDVIYRTLKNYYELLHNGTIRLFGWGKFRWFECYIAIEWAYDRYGEQWLLDLARLLREQGQDYIKCMPKWKRPLNAWTFETHIVNIAMSLKCEALSASLLGEEYTDMAEEMYQKLYEWNGTPVGLFTGDECLSGLSPIQGTELCAVVEQMYSYELLFACTGDNKWAERLEVLAYNALPATISDDMWTHQYVQMSNQIACERFPGKSIFRTNGPEAHLFGLEPNYGCCTANFNQGWPKFTQSAFLHRADTILAALLVPAELQTEGIHIKCITDYPFENSVTYIIDAEKAFTFQIRIPSFAKNVCLNGELVSSGDIVLPVESRSKQKVHVTFGTEAYFEKRPHNLCTAKCGSLVFAVPIQYQKKMREYTSNNVERKFPYCDYEYKPLSDWNYAYCSKEIAIDYREINEIPFSSEHPPVVLRTKVKKIDWGYADGYNTVCAKIPESTDPISDEIDVELYPYGCAKLRMTEIPMLTEN